MPKIKVFYQLGSARTPYLLSRSCKQEATKLQDPSQDLADELTKKFNQLATQNAQELGDLSAKILEDLPECGVIDGETDCFSAFKKVEELLEQVEPKKDAHSTEKPVKLQTYNMQPIKSADELLKKMEEREREEKCSQMDLRLSLTPGADTLNQGAILSPINVDQYLRDIKAIIG